MIQIMRNRNFQIISLIAIYLVVVAYSFLLATKRYDNFEYGKFDLGNMAQMVWNSSQGNFMEVTDQFGTNMPRWGMSHIDPIIAIFTPIYWVYPHPMLLVFFQHLLVVSAIFPLFALIKWKTRSTIASYLIVFSYIFYPANGFTLVWTGFHGISFVAPVLIWLVWYLERNKFLVNAALSQKLVYWSFIFVMLMGKEEIGAILAIGSIFLYFKNKKLAIYTFIFSAFWTLLCFLVFIPSYSHYRTESVNTFFDRVGVSTKEAENISGENFFINRYAYLGNSYGEILKNALLKPGLIIEKTFTEDKVEAINNLYGPLGYLVILSPFWLVSIPDLAIVLLSEEAIFDISNHRIAFVTVGLFISLIYLFQFIRSIGIKYKQEHLVKYTVILFSLLILILNIYFSERTSNPLYVSGRSFLTDKIISKIMAQSFRAEQKNSRVPRNDNKCLEEMVGLINEYNPDIYTGPDYLGAHSSNRRVNALFPSRYWDADFVIADIYESKTLGAFGDSGWIFNKDSLRKMLTERDFSHVYSCGKVFAFAKGSFEPKDISEFVTVEELSQYAPRFLSTKSVTLNVRIIDIPEKIKISSPEPFVIAAAMIDGTFYDKVTFWIFEDLDNSENRFQLIDYMSIGDYESLDTAEKDQYVMETYYPKLHNIKPGKYKVSFGVGDLLNASESFVGNIEITE